jgi:hypothetical protein
MLLVHELRPWDIDLLGALGDSITVRNFFLKECYRWLIGSCTLLGWLRSWCKQLGGSCHPKQGRVVGVSQLKSVWFFTIQLCFLIFSIGGDGSLFGDDYVITLPSKYTKLLNVWVNLTGSSYSHFVFRHRSSVQPRRRRVCSWHGRNHES